MERPAQKVIVIARHKVIAIELVGDDGAGKPGLLFSEANLLTNIDGTCIFCKFHQY